MPLMAEEIRALIKRGEIIEEIRVRRFGESLVLLSGGRAVRLLARADGALERLLLDVCSGSVYAHRDSIISGYVPMACGVRVGVAGRAGYDGELVGIRDISLLVFRIPLREAPIGRELYREWLNRGEKNTLIISPPCGGKSTALFSLLSRIAKDGGRRTVAVDERCEADTEALLNAGVDVLSGYRRQKGIEIAVRTLSADVLACDEIFTEGDSEALLLAHGSGVTVIASTHARDKEGLKEREGLRPLLDKGVFKTLFTLGRRGSEFTFSVSEL